MNRIVFPAMVVSTLLGWVLAYPTRSDSTQDGAVVQISVKKFEFRPVEISVKRGVPVTLELTSEDRIHGFNLPDLNLRTDVNPGEVARLSFAPSKTGRFRFYCDVYCGDGHEAMKGELIVTD